METSHLPLSMMASIHTASVTSIGQHLARTSHSMSMALSMYRKRRLHQILWRLKVCHRQSTTDVGISNSTLLVRQLSELLAQVKDEQSYIVLREKTHRNTAESTNARVKWWSVFQMLVLIGEGIFQVWWLKRFFEVKSSERFGVLSR